MSTTLVHIVTIPDSFRTFFEGQLRYMESRGLDVHAISSPGPLLGEFAEAEGVDVHEVKITRKISPWKDFVSIISLCLVLRRLRPEIVHAHTPKAGLIGMVAAWITRVPVRIYQIHGLPIVTMSGPRRWLLRLSERVACLLAHKVLCVSHSVRAIAIEEQLCRPKKISVLHNGSCNGVDVACRFNPLRTGLEARTRIRRALNMDENSMAIGFVGRLACDKGVFELAEAWGVLSEEIPTLHLLIVGADDSRDPIPAALADKLRNHPRAHFIGEIKDIHEYYSAIDVCVLPTYREGLSTVLLEAAAMECPVVASNVPGCVDAVVDGETGFLVPPQDSAALCVAIRKYLRSRDLRVQHGQSARRWVKKTFSREKIWKSLHSEYQDLAVQQGIAFPDAKDYPGSERKAA
jgi:glycosyltransferase involved in cell wall biosynthesis